MRLSVLLTIGKLLALFCSLAGGAELRDVCVRIRNQEPGGQSSLGSGVVVALADGSPAVLSCHHTFRDGIGTITVYSGNQAFPARLIKQDQRNDLSLLAVDGTLPSGVVVAAEHAQRGESAWGAGFGPDGRYREFGGRVRGYLGGHLAIDGAARSGDSGGPIFNERGEVAAVLWGTDGEETLGTPVRPIHSLLAGVTETQCRDGSCYSGGGGSVGLGIQWQRPQYAAPAPRRTAPPAAIATPRQAPADPPLAKVSPPCKSCECDAAGMKTEIAALKIEIGNLQTQLATLEARPEPTQITAADIEAALKRQPLRAQIVGPDGKVLSQQQTFLGGDPLRFQLRPKEVVRK